MLTSQNPDETKKQLQAKVVELITKKLESGEMSPERAKEIAALVLDKMPEHVTQEELLEIIPKLDDEFDELAAVVVPVMLEYEKQMRAEINQQLDQYLQNKNFDQVLELTKKAIEQEKQLT